mgnify:CR=1 FL=1
MKEFKEFLLQGNLIELAVAFIMGTAFALVVESFTQIIMDIIGKFGGNPDFSTVTIAGINVGVFLTALVSFIIVAAVIFFGVVKPYNRFQERFMKKEEEEEGPSTEELLTDIRDLLKNQA